MRFTRVFSRCLATQETACFRSAVPFAGHVLPEVESKNGSRRFCRFADGHERGSAVAARLGGTAPRQYVSSLAGVHAFSVRNTTCVEQGTKSSDAHVLHVGLHHPSLVHCCGARSGKTVRCASPSDRKQLGPFQCGCASQLCRSSVHDEAEAAVDSVRCACLEGD